MSGMITNFANRSVLVSEGNFCPGPHTHTAILGKIFWLLLSESKVDWHIPGNPSSKKVTFSFEDTPQLSAVDLGGAVLDFDVPT